MKRAVLLNLSVIVEVDEAELLRDHGELDEISNRLIDALDAVVPGGWQSLRQSTLDPAALNCGRCAECDGWVTDCERPEPLDGLCNGATHDGRLLCDEHLPPDHRWAF